MTSSKQAAGQATLKQKLNHYYTSQTPEGRRFRYGILAFDLIAVTFIIATSFLPRSDFMETLDGLFGIAMLTEFSARMYSMRAPLRELLHPATWADMAAIASFLAPILGEGAGFLRILRTVRLLRTYHLLSQLRRDFSYFRRNEDIILASVNLCVFLFVMTALVYESQHLTNPQIKNYADALYFTVTALTTTGFGDITLQGSSGRLISVVIMILGVTLFLNLLRTILQPTKVRYRCPSCGLMRHDYDAVHCKACGNLLNIPDEGKL
ncbi:MAG: potassium channel family protein [Hyphomicrobiaceae bacterium]|nr:potassium channel family protein [Hyphomicrobiaceae bacterium]